MLDDKDKIAMAESIIQEWFHFGALHLHSEISQVPIDLDRYISIDESSKLTVVSSY